MRETEKIVYRDKTRRVNAGRIAIGGGSSVSVQSMLSVPTTDFPAALAQIRALEFAGCDIIRLAIRDEDALRAFRKLRKSVETPLVADIHFDYRLAIGAAEAGADKLRINPGNIGSAERVRAVADVAKDCGIPIRVGVNAGSLPEDLAYGGPTPDKMVESARREIEQLVKSGFEDIVVSLKSHDVTMTVEANRLFMSGFDFPLHIGITEAGLPPEALIKGSAGIGSLLLDGIGDTIRFSITGDPVQEVIAGKALLRACGLLESGIELVCCPVCGRCRVDLAEVAREVADKLPRTNRQLVVAVMGCEVNGPGEAKNADIGIAGGNEEYLLFRRGEVIGKIPQEHAVQRLIDEIESVLGESEK